MNRKRLSAFLATTAFAAAACAGDIGGGSGGQFEPDHPDHPQTTAPMGPSISPRPTSTAGEDPDRPPVAGPASLVGSAAPLRRLTHDEYDATVADLLGTTQKLSANFPKEVEEHGYLNQAEVQAPSLLLIERYADASVELAAEAVGTEAKRKALVPCVPAGASDRACMTKFVETFGVRAFRRPPPAVEVESLVDKGMAEAAAEGDFWKGVSLVVEVVLQSPLFLYRFESGEPSVEKPGLLALDGFSVASRLSYLLIGTMPDQALFDAAARKELATAAQVKAQAERLLAIPSARLALRRFLSQWLGYLEVLEVEKDPATYPKWTKSLASNMATETNRLLDFVVWGEDRNFFSFLTADQSFVNPALATHYGIPTSSTMFERVPLPTHRRGFLGHGSFLSLRARFDSSSPTQRGLVIRERFFCQVIAPPPPGVDFAAVAPVDDRPMTGRERYSMHAQSGCVECHRLMDPIGFGLEKFDGIGAYRETEVGKPIDDSGTIESASGGAAHAFKGLPELGRLLAEDPEVKSCLVRQFGRWWLGRKESSDDSTTLDEAQRAFAGDGYRFKALLIAAATSDATRFTAPPARSEQP
jgi:hypothetical protein